LFKKALKSKVIPYAVVSSLAIGAFAGFAPKEEAKTKEPEIKNIIFLIGDGMGVPYLTAHRYMMDNPSTPEIEKTFFDQHLVGMQTTYPEDPKQNITDSASAATAMSAGIKTYNNAIAVDNDLTEVKTVLEEAKAIGKATGLVATSEITHATPASFGAHDPSRKNMDQIADDYYDELINGEHKVDVLLGGGLKNFQRSDRDLVEAFKKDGFSYVTSKNELLNDTNEQILGLFADGGMPKMIDRTEDLPSLEDMTKSSIERLKKDKDGFFLMVEGSEVDWAGHDNDIVAAMSDMNDFEKAFKAAIEFAKEDKHTLVVATADHSTGGFSMGANGVYNWYPEPIKAAKRTPDFMAQEIAKGAAVEDVLNQYSGLQLAPEEVQSVKDAAVAVNGQIDVTKVDNAIEKIYDNRSISGWTTGGHTGEDVAVLAYGPGKEEFAGLIDNTDQAKNIFKILEDTKNWQNRDVAAPTAPAVYTIADNSTLVKGRTERDALVTAKVGTKVIGTAKAKQDGKFEIKIAKQKAGTKITVTAVDSEENVSAPTTVTVVDKTAPVAPKVNSVTSTATTVTGTAEANTLVTVKAGKTLLGRAKADSKGKYSIKIKAQKKNTVLTVTATDSAKNQSAAIKVTVR
jgi:alkaline phosphatase